MVAYQAYAVLVWDYLGSHCDQTVIVSIPCFDLVPQIVPVKLSSFEIKLLR